MASTTVPADYSWTAWRTWTCAPLLFRASDQRLPDYAVPTGSDTADARAPPAPVHLHGPPWSRMGCARELLDFASEAPGGRVDTRATDRCTEYFMEDGPC